MRLPRNSFVDVYFLSKGEFKNIQENWKYMDTSRQLGRWYVLTKYNLTTAIFWTKIQIIPKL